MNGGRYLWIIKEWQVRRNYSGVQERAHLHGYYPQWHYL